MAPTAKTKQRPTKSALKKSTNKKSSTKKSAPTLEKRAAKPGEPMSLAEVMRVLEASGSEQARKTYARHGAKGPMFGVSFGALSALQKRIRVDHALALKLWDTGNVDARNLAMKIADPAAIKASDLDRWAREIPFRMTGLYIGSLAQESPHGLEKAKRWLAASDIKLRVAGWTLVSVLASRDEASPDADYAKYLVLIEKSIHTAPNEEKSAMNAALISIGGRSAGLRKAATATAKRIGKVDVDHGDTSCETPDAASYIDKSWERLSSKFPTPAAAERARESMRTRC